MAGAALTYAFTTKASRQGLGVPGLGDGVSVAQGFGVEFIFSFMLVFFVFSIVDDKKKIDPFGMALGIGLVVVVAHVAAVSIITMTTLHHMQLKC